MKDFLDVYIKKYPFECDNNPILKERQEDIDNSYDDRHGSNPEEKLYGWKLLEKACRQSLGKELNALNPRKLDTGKWVIDNYFISLSNSGTYVMVGISNKPIGVDVQKNREMSACYSSSELIQEELKYYGKDDIEKHLCVHTQKEAIFKCYGNGPFQIINTLLYKDRVKTLNCGKYIYSICSDLIKNAININYWLNDEPITEKELKAKGGYYEF